MRTRLAQRLAIVGCILLAVVVLGASQVPSKRVAAGPTHLMYVRGNSIATDDPFDLWIMNEDGTNPQRLTVAATNREDNASPAFSADGRHVAFMSYRDNSRDKLGEVYIADLLTGPQGVFYLGNVLRQTNDIHSDDMDPAWSPACDELVFGTNTPDSYYGIYRLSLATNTQQRVTGNTNEYSPSWSATNNKIVFMRGDGLDSEIWTRHMGTGDEKRLTNNHRVEWNPSWTPSGRVIFERRDDDRVRIYEIDENGGDEQVMTDTAKGESDWSASYSPDGTRLAFVRMPAFDNVVNADIFVRDIATKAEANITNTPYANETEVVWQPDGACPSYPTLKSLPRKQPVKRRPW